MTDSMLRLPKIVESNSLAPRVHQYLAAHTLPLWSKGAIETPFARMTPALSKTILRAKGNDQVVRGLENAQRRLASEARGLHLADQASRVARGVRVSRLLILANDGAERFYRQVEALLRTYGNRVMALRLDTDAELLGELIFGTGRITRLLMLEHKDAVSNVLFELAEQDKT